MIGQLVQTWRREKLAMEDFCPLGGLLPADKYSGSAEGCAKTVQRFSTSPPIDQRTLFLQFLFSWWVGNGDLHLKAKSWIEFADACQLPHKATATAVARLLNDVPEVLKLVELSFLPDEMKEPYAALVKERSVLLGDIIADFEKT